MKGELFNVNFCETEVKQGDAIKEESIVLHFPISQASSFAEMSEVKIKEFFADGVRDGFPMGKASKIRSSVYNLKFNLAQGEGKQAKEYSFRGVKFNSAEVKRAKGIGDIIILRCRLEYEQSFHDDYPGFIRKMIDISLKSVGQMSIEDQKGQGEE